MSVDTHWLSISRRSNARLALFLAVALFGLAGAFIYFVHPGGFESQTVWAFAFLPGLLPAYAVTAVTDKAPAFFAGALFAAFFLLFNLLWYWAISYVIVRMARRWKTWDGF